MQFAKLLLIGSSFVVATLAQQQIAFTQVPASAQAGVSTTLRWAGGDDSPVTITLKQGDPDNLETVAILTGSASGNSYTWTPSPSLPSRDDYALQISQGVNDINYSGQFALSGGSTSTSTSSSSSSSDSSLSSVSSRITPAVIVPIASLNSTVAILTNTTASATTTRFLAAGTGAVGSGGISAATGTALSRNTTLSSATLSASRTSSTGDSSTTSDSESTGTSTGSAEGSEATGDAMRMASPLAFMLSAFVAIIYLG